MPWARIRLLVVLAVALAAPRSWAQLCGPAVDPCVVTSDVAVPGGSIIDLGSRGLVIGASRTLTVQGTGTGNLVVYAGYVTLASGAKIIAPGLGGLGGSVAVVTTGAVQMEAGSRIEVNGASAGFVDIAAASLRMDGSISAVAGTRDGLGGDVSVVVTNSLAIGGGGIDVTGGDRDGFGGSIYMIGGGDAEVNAPLVTKGGFGGDLDIDVQGDLLLKAGSQVVTIATLAAEDGGSVSFYANGLVSMLGSINLRAAGSLLEGAGFAGDFDIIAGRVESGASIEMSGPGPDGYAGFFDITSDSDVILNGSLNVSGAAEGDGGDVLITANDEVTIGATIDARGGSAGGGVDVSTAGPVVLTSGSNMDVSALPGLAILGRGGYVSLAGCDATLAGAIRAVGTGTSPQAAIMTFTSGTLTVSGTLVAPGGVTFSYRSQPPVIMPGAVIAPPPVQLPLPGLPCCGVCGTTTSSTTSTSQPPSTTTSITSTTIVTTSSSTVSTSSSSVTTSSNSSVTTSSSSSVTTSSSSSVTTSSSSSSSTVVSSTSSTTVTTIPVSCLDEPLQGYAALECAIGLLQDVVAAQPEIALGGRRSAKRLAGKVAKMQTLVEKSRSSAKAARLLAKAEKKVASFQTQVAKLEANQKIENLLATELLELSGEVTVRIDGVLAPLGD